MVKEVLKVSLDALIARERVKTFYLKIINKLLQKIDKKNIMKEIVAEKTFGTLKIKGEGDVSETQSKEFSRETKSAAYIREGLRGTPKCKICGGYIPDRFNSIDHIKRKADGGLGTIDNAQLTQSIL